MAFAELCARILAALVLAGSLFVSSYLVAGRLLPRAPTLVRWSGAVVAGMWLASVGFQLLARASLYVLPAALAGAAALAALSLAPPAARRAVLGWAARDRRFVRRLARAARRSRWRGLVVAFAVCAAPVLVRALLVPPLGWDAITWHSVRAGSWVQDGQLTPLLAPGAWTTKGHSPAGGVVFASWSMLAYHGDLFVGAVDAAFWLCLGPIVWALAREIGVKEPWGTAAAGLVLAIPTLRLEIGAGYVEPALVCAFGAGALLTVRFLRRAEPGALVLAAAGLGLACAMKANALVLGALGMAFLAGRSLLVRPRRVGSLAAAALAFAAPLAPWLVDAWRATGYPLSPLSVSVAGIRLGVADEAVKWFSARPAMKPYDWGQESEAFKKLFAFDVSDTKEGLGFPLLLPLVVFVLTSPWLVRTRKAAGAFLVLAVAAVIFFVFQRDFSAVRLLWWQNVARFWLPAYVVAVPASMAWCARWPAPGRVYHALTLSIAFFSLLRVTHFGWSGYDLDAAFRVCAWAFVLYAGFALLRALRVPFRGAALAAGIVLALAAAGGFASARRGQAIASSTVFHEVWRYWAQAADKLDEPERPKRIAFTGGPQQNADEWFAYYFMGRHLQNHVFYVPITADGTVGEYTPDDALRRRADREAWLGRIDALGVDAVVAMRPRYVELEWMEALPDRFQHVGGDGKSWGVYLVKRPPRAG